VIFYTADILGMLSVFYGLLCFVMRCCVVPKSGFIFVLYFFYAEDFIID